MATEPSPTKQSKNKWLAALLNLFLPGLGYLYVGKGKRTGLGVGLLIASAFGFMEAGARGALEGKIPSAGTFIEVVALIGMLIMAIVFAWDAYKDAGEFGSGA